MRVTDRLLRLAAMAVCGLACFPGARADDTRGEPPQHLAQVTRDGGGAIWGLVSNQYANSGLYRFENERWRTVSVDELPARSWPLCFVLRSDGSVVCLWVTGENQRAFSVHRGAASRASGTFSLATPQPRFIAVQSLFADSKNNVWLTGAGPEIWRLSPEGRAECVHVIQPEECLAQGRPVPGDSDPNHWNKVAAVEDAQGRLWFYSGDNIHSHATLRGALVFDGGNFTSRELTAPGNPVPRFSMLAQKDAGHLWVGTVYDGLFTLDTATLALERLPGQPEEARSTHGIFRQGDDWFFIFGPAGLKAVDPLWRLRNGHWDKLIESVDANPSSYAKREDRLWTRTAGGNYLGSVGNGLFFVPEEGAPEQLNWKRGFPLGSPCDLIPLPDHHRWLGISTRGQTWMGNPDSFFADPAPPFTSGASVLRIRANIRGDPRGHLWSLFDNESSSLREWDGHNWIEHAIPGLGPDPYLDLLNIDLRGRVWIQLLVRSVGREDRTLIYDPAADHWEDFASFHDALQAQAGRTDALFAPWNGSFDVSRFGPFNLPQYGPNGRICYLSTRGGLIDVYDGHSWRRWTAKEVTGGMHGGFAAAPFFNRAGQPSVNEYHQTFSCMDGSSWQITPFEPGFADFEALAGLLRQRLPPEIKPPVEPESCAMDNRGVWWFVSQGMLYRAREGLFAPVFAPGEAQPYLDGRTLGGAFIDEQGNTFLRSDDHGPGDYVIVPPPGNPPHTTLAEVSVHGEGTLPAPADRLAFCLMTDARPIKNKTRFFWRLDEGSWTPLAVDGPAGIVIFDGMPGGTHHLEARSVDPAMQTDPTPAALTFEVHLDPRAQVAGYIAQLADPDGDRRKAAVLALARQPELAGEALRAARAAVTNEDNRWWIDAALQQIETAKHAASSSIEAAH